jgi:hypothetical protein
MEHIYASPYYRGHPDAEHFELNDRYKEIIRLHEMLAENDIPHVIRRCLDGWQVCYPEVRPGDECVVDAVEHLGSYGRELDLLEIMGLLTPEEEAEDNIAGYLTAENVFERFKNHWGE